MTTRVERGVRVGEAAAPLLLLNAQYLPSSVDWRRTGDQHSPYDIGTFVRAAQRAEDAGFDAFFQADFSGVNRAGLRSGPPLTVFEPFQVAALIATSTSRIAVMPTVSTLHTHPFTFARNLASLDRLSNGRAWVNVVSSFRSGTALGQARTIPRARRHEQTEEFVGVARRLWSSWPPTANEPDRTTDRYVRDELIMDVDHVGTFYEQQGPIDMPPLCADFPFTLQATASAEGLRLAARTADGVFAGTPTIGAAQALRRILQRESERAGRSSGDVALLPGCYVHVVEEGERTRLAFDERRRAAGEFTGAAALAEVRVRFPELRLGDSSVGDRLPSDVLPDDPDEVFERFGSRCLPLWDLARDRSKSVGDFVGAVLGLSEHARFVGSAEHIADEIVRWIEEGAVDGFQIILGNDFDAVTDRIVPAVREATRRRSARFDSPPPVRSQL